MTLDLQLLGTPKLKVSGQTVTVSPPATFELVCLIIVSGESGISRKTAAMHLWSHLEPKYAQAQLRYNLMKLRDHVALTGFFDLETNHLRVLPQVNVAVDIHRATTPRATELPNFIQLLATPWKREHWQHEADTYAAKLAGWLELLGDEVPLHSVQLAHLCFPDSFPLANHLVKRLQRSERLTEANEVVIRFEDAWVERFGVVDIPTISIIGKGDHQTVLEALPASVPISQLHSQPNDNQLKSLAGDKRRATMIAFGPKLILFFVPIFCLVVVVAAIGYTLNLGRGAEKRPKLTLVDTTLASGFHVRKFNVEGAYPKEFSALVSPDGQPLLQFQNQLCQIKFNGEVFPKASVKWIPNSALGATSIELTPENSQLRISTTNKTYIIGPTTDFPAFDGPMVVGEGSIVFSRLCGHSFRDHRKLSYWKNGTENPIHISTPEPQNAVVTCTTPQGLYGKYSMGKSDGWKYHSFFFDFQSQKTQLINSPPVVAEFGGSVLVRPERTDLINGDYQNHPLDYALVIDKSGRQKKLSLATNKDVVGTFGGYIYVCRNNSQFTSELEFLNFDLEKVKPFPSLPKVILAFTVHTADTAICVGFDPDRPTKDLFLISKR